MDSDLIRRQVAQLIIVRASGSELDSQRKFPKWELSNFDLKRLIDEGIGGVIFLGGSINELSERCKKLRILAGRDLLLCADVEEGIGQRFEGGTHLVPPMSIAIIYKKNPNKAISLAEQYGKCIAYQAIQCGLNWVLAPVCDINNNPRNPVINMRAWGEDPNTVSELVCAFQKGLKSYGVLSCLKHFPGHGDTTIDSHLALPKISRKLEELNEYELLPFKKAILNGADSVMTAHLLLSEIDPYLPSTLSPNVLDNLLRRYIGFDGLIVTDALLMKAISAKYDSGQASLLAFSAGADLIMMPSNPDEAIDAISSELISGNIPLSKLENSLSRRRNALLKSSKFRSNIDISIATEELSAESKSTKIFLSTLISESMDTDRVKLIDLNNIGTNLIRIKNESNSLINKSTPAFKIPRSLGFKNIIFNEYSISPWKNKNYEPFDFDRFSQGKFFLQLFIRGNPFMDNNYEEEPWIYTINQLQRHKLLAGLVVYGSHYFWHDIKFNLHPSIPAGYSPAQTPEAQLAILSLLFKEAKNDILSQSYDTSQFTN